MGLHKHNKSTCSLLIILANRCFIIKLVKPEKFYDIFQFSGHNHVHYGIFIKCYSVSQQYQLNKNLQLSLSAPLFSYAYTHKKAHSTLPPLKIKHTYYLSVSKWSFFATSLISCKVLKKKLISKEFEMLPFSEGD